MTVFEKLKNSIRLASTFNPDVQAAPECILWPDHGRQWEAVIPVLQTELPELLVLGDYAPDVRTGPAIWLRCALARRLAGLSLPENKTPILYLPGVSRQDLRAVEECPDALKPLAELQYRGVIWSQVNAKDWTIRAWLVSDQGGLGLDVAQDNKTQHALQLALHKLLDEDTGRLREKRLDKDYFNTLLTSGDANRDVLQWLDQGDAFKTTRGAHEWQAFVELCKSRWAFDPDKDGVLAGCRNLALREGPWRPVWERFCEAPRRYPNIPVQLRQCQPPPFDLFADATVAGAWPQWNDQQEQDLRQGLIKLAQQSPQQARETIHKLEAAHGERRALVWASLGEAPLALALQHLAVMAAHTASALTAGSADEMATIYQETGWLADDAVLRALAAVERNADLDAVTTAIRATYWPWAEDGARQLQHVVDDSSYPGGTHATATPFPVGNGECVFFVDGLRFDTGKRLAQMLQSAGMDVTEAPAWTALPSVTATGKPAVSPVRDQIIGDDGSTDFEPAVAATGQSLHGGYHFKKLLQDAGWTILGHGEVGTGQGRAWCAFGDIDHEGHDRGWKLARHLDALLTDVSNRIHELLEAGWQRVRVVTDHGWLLLPGGLPKIDMPAALTTHKWGRCAALKPGAETQEQLFPWYWNPSHYFVLANGISCFRKGTDYAHGGLSLQECLTLQLTIGSGAQHDTVIEFTDIVWRGLRCTIAVDGTYTGLELDIRNHAGDAASSVVVSSKPLKDNGTASVVVEDEDLEGRQAAIVLLDGRGKLVAQLDTVIGGDNA